MPKYKYLESEEVYAVFGLVDEIIYNDMAKTSPLDSFFLYESKVSDPRVTVVTTQYEDEEFEKLGSWIGIRLHDWGDFCLYACKDAEYIWKNLVPKRAVQEFFRFSNSKFIQEAYGEDISRIHRPIHYDTPHSSLDPIIKYAKGIIFNHISKSEDGLQILERIIRRSIRGTERDLMFDLNRFNRQFSDKLHKKTSDWSLT